MSVGKDTGELFMSGPNLLNLLNSILDKASALHLSPVATHSAESLAFWTKHSNVINLISTMSFLLVAELLFIILHTLSLLQCSLILAFLKFLIHKSTATVTAKSSKYSILGLYCLNQIGSHF